MKVDRVRFVDVLTDRVPIIVEPDIDDWLPVECMGFRFVKEFNPWGESPVYTADPWSAMVTLPPAPNPCPHWGDIDVPGPGDPYFPVVAAPLVADPEAGWAFRPSPYMTWDMVAGRALSVSWSEVSSPRAWDTPASRMFEVSVHRAAAAFWSRAFAAGAAWDAEVYDDLSAVESNMNDTIKTLVELAREGKREDFDFLAAASGVHSGQREDLWAGTRRRLHKEATP